jgi:hypothetical protein
MTWEELTSQEKTALRHLAKGEVQEVPWRQIRRLRELGLADDNPEGGSPPPGWNSGGRGRREPAPGSDAACYTRQAHRSPRTRAGSLSYSGASGAANAASGQA